MSELQTHWQSVYTNKAPANVSWYQAAPTQSLAYIQQAGLSAGAHILDVGAGASVLADALVALGYRLSLLDIAEAALNVTRARLGAAQAAALTWLIGDVTHMTLPPQTYDLWHDRAVFHFLIDPAQRQRYIERAQHSIKAGGYLLLATFASDGPTQCSGLDVMRYEATDLHALFGAAFDLIADCHEVHRTPWDSTQHFTYALFRRHGV